MLENTGKLRALLGSLCLHLIKYQKVVRFDGRVKKKYIDCRTAIQRYFNRTLYEVWIAHAGILDDHILLVVSSVALTNIVFVFVGGQWCLWNSRISILCQLLLLFWHNQITFKLDPYIAYYPVVVIIVSLLFWFVLPAANSVTSSCFSARKKVFIAILIHLCKYSNDIGVYTLFILCFYRINSCPRTADLRSVFLNLDRAPDSQT